MKKLFLLFPFSFFLLFPIILKAQIEEEHKEKEKGIYEIITSGIYAHSFKHNEGVVGTEIHFTYWFNHKWGGGVSYTSKFEEDEILNDIALIGSMNPAHWITLNSGISFGLSGEHREFSIGAYTEAEINIRPNKWFHFGPVLGAILSKDSEGTVGFHLGFEF